MITFSIEPLHKFISSNGLNQNKDIILFNAAVEYQTNNKLQNIHSQVLIVILPGQVAVYILEFLKETFQLSELYSTSNFHFKCPDVKKLEIYPNEKAKEFLLAITPL